MNRRTSGFTLVELLIALLIVSLILSAVVSVYVGTTRSAASLQTRNDLQPELQVTQNYMASKLRQASYVFPIGANVQMSATGVTSQNPAGGQNWRVGTDAIVAFILPPRSVSPSPTVTCANTTSPDLYCYAFYAFYAIKRSDYVGTATVAGVTGADNPGKNPANDSTAWVLMEYRGYYSNPATSYAGTGFSQFVTEIPTGNRGRMLMDYLVPYSPSPATPLFSTNVTQTPPGNQVAGVATVTMNLAALQTVAGQAVRVPAGTTTTYSTLTVYPRNVGKPLLAN
ncbi:PulJ/GspJ family protein [Deinococcus sp. UYEF24]